MMKTKIYPLIISVIFALLILNGCKKKDETPPVPSPKSQKQSDQSGSTAADDGLEDVNDFISNKIGNGSNARVAAYNLPCGVVSVDSTTGSNGVKTYKMKYGSQTPCGYKKKSGEIAFQLVNGEKFSDQNAVFSVTFTEYKVQVLATDEIVILNGTLYVTNLDGGHIWQAITESKVIRHKVRGNFFITYANNEVRERNYYKLKTWSSSNSWAGLVFTVSGDTLINSENIFEIGKTYEGNYDFRTQILQDFKWENCGSTYAGPYVLKTGHAKMHVTIPNISDAYYELEAGYKADVGNLPAFNSTLVNDCSSNAYKINIVIGASTSTQYQLY